MWLLRYGLAELFKHGADDAVTPQAQRRYIMTSQWSYHLPTWTELLYSNIAAAFTLYHEYIPIYRIKQAGSRHMNNDF